MSAMRLNAIRMLAKYPRLTEDRDTLLVCPFDPTHIVRAGRWVRHLDKCRLSHRCEYTSSTSVYRDEKYVTARGDEFKRCPYNSFHYILREEYDNHLSTCEDKEAVYPTQRTPSICGNLDFPHPTGHWEREYIIIKVHPIRVTVWLLRFRDSL